MIQAPDQALDQMVYRVPESGPGDFRIGSQVIVRENQAAVFYRDGKALDTFGPGRHTITTANIPLLIDLLKLGTRGQTPFTAEVYFVNTRDFIDMKWGTQEPIAVRDKDLGLARLRANGRYSMAITDPQLFVTKIVGTQGLYQTNQIADYLRGIIVSRLTDLLGESKAGLFDLPALFDEMNAAARVKVAEDFAALGITIKAMYIQSISPTEETARAIDERAAMGAIGDMQKYLQFQAARAMGDAARASGEAGSAMGTGVGLGAGIGVGAGMAGMISQAIQGAAQPAQPPQAAPAAGPAAVPEVMNVAEAAAYLKVSQQDVLNLITSGQVKAKQIGSEYRISKKVLDEFLAS
ncbi:MAG: SPFH domain-containing protein [Anaerolineae bacterium]|nr:SPFH domain-containing protein [Anaerolineae bacterium]